jgi:hypothetical protein
MGIIARIGHRKYTMRVGTQQKINVYRQCASFTTQHHLRVSPLLAIGF